MHNRVGYGLIQSMLAINTPAFFHCLSQERWCQVVFNQWLSKLNLNSELSVLEIGCGAGSLGNQIDAKVENYVGVDHSVSMVRYAKNKYVGIEYQKTNSEKLPFNDDVFDLVIAANLVNVVKDKKQLLIEMKRAVKVTGQVCLLVPNSEFNELYGVLREYGNTWFSRLTLRYWSAKVPKMSFDEVSAMLQDLGLVEVGSSFLLGGMFFSVVIGR